MNNEELNSNNLPPPAPSPHSRRKPILLMALAVLLTLGVLTVYLLSKDTDQQAQQSSQTTKAPQDIIYFSPKLGFSMPLPTYWKYNHGFIETDNAVTFEMKQKENEKYVPVFIIHKCSYINRQYDKAKCPGSFAGGHKDKQVVFTVEKLEPQTGPLFGELESREKVFKDLTEKVFPKFEIR